MTGSYDKEKGRMRRDGYEPGHRAKRLDKATHEQYINDAFQRLLDDEGISCVDKDAL